MAGRGRLGWILIASLAITAATASAQPSPPPDVAKVMEKMQRGEKPTKAEIELMKKWVATLRQWNEGLKKNPWKGMPGGGPPPGAFQQPGAPTLEGMGVCPKATVKLPTKAPTPAGYSKIAGDIAAAYRKRLGASAAKLDPDIAKTTTPNATTGLVGGALASGSGAGAIYVAARAAAAHPKDPLVASNLGALLVADRKYSDAYSVLLHADALAPDQKLVTTNRAWAQYGARDPRAKATFESVTAKESDHASARLGLGLLAACGGDAKAGADHIAASAMRRKSALAQYAYAAVSPSSPSPYTGSNPLELPPLPISASWDLSAKDKRDSAALHKQLLEIHLKWTAGLQARNDKIKSLYAQGRRGGIEGNLYASLHEPYSKAASAKAKEGVKQLVQMPSDLTQWTLSAFQRTAPARQACQGDSRCVKQVEFDDCMLTKQRAIEGHAKFAPLAQRGWADAKPLVEEMWLRSTGLLERYHDPEWAELHRANLEAEVALDFNMFVTPVYAWSGLVDAIHRTQCVPPPPPPSGPEPDAKIPGVKADGCGLPAFEVEIKVVSFEIECLEVKVQVKSPAGPMAYLQYDALKGQTTVFAGIGAGDTIGGSGLEGRVGVFVEVTGSTLTGVGLEAEGTAKLGGVGGEAKFRADALALEGGAPVADSFSKELSTTLDVK